QGRDKRAQPHARGRLGDGAEDHPGIVDVEPKVADEDQVIPQEHAVPTRLFGLDGQGDHSGCVGEGRDADGGAHDLTLRPRRDGQRPRPSAGILGPCASRSGRLPTNRGARSWPRPATPRPRGGTVRGSRTTSCPTPTGPSRSRPRRSRLGPWWQLWQPPCRGCESAPWSLATPTATRPWWPTWRSPSTT